MTVTIGYGSTDSAHGHGRMGSGDGSERGRQLRLRKPGLARADRERLWTLVTAIMMAQGCGWL